jgi:prepilin-type N-terminal cleavage/methylation domain-containing protein
VKKHNSGQRHNKSGQQGFTLVELVFVIGIILVLAGIFIPVALQKLEDADSARTNADLQAISGALTTFFSDLRRFPACNDTGDDCDPFNKNNNDLKLLVFKADPSVVATGDIADQDSTVNCSTSGSLDWDDTNNLETGEEGKNNAFNHLVLNDPNADGTVDDETTGNSDYSTKRFEGPYISKLSTDAFGNFYIAHVGAMEKGGTTITNTSGTAQGWILSAGPDGFFQTCPNSTSVQSDDRGFIFVTKQ